MKIILKIIFAAIIGSIIYGYFINSSNDGAGEKFIGIGVITFAFIFMPLFIYYRYKDKDLSKYSFNNSQKEEEGKEKIENKK